MITDEMVEAAYQVFYEPRPDGLVHDFRPSWTRLRKALEAVAPMLVPEWQPIETAPKDWGDYLVWSSGYGIAIRGFQLLNGGSDGRLAGHWYDDEDVCRDYEITHWMPLPAAPSPTDVEAKHGR